MPVASSRHQRQFECDQTFATIHENAWRSFDRSLIVSDIPRAIAMVPEEPDTTDAGQNADRTCTEIVLVQTLAPVCIVLPNLHEALSKSLNDRTESMLFTSGQIMLPKSGPLGCHVVLIVRGTSGFSGSCVF